MTCMLGAVASAPSAVPAVRLVFTTSATIIAIILAAAASGESSLPVANIALDNVEDPPCAIAIITVGVDHFAVEWAIV